MASMLNGRGLRIRLGRTPVVIDWTFFVVIAVYGALLRVNGNQLSILEVLALGGIALLSIFWHEAGHALALRAVGRDSRIVIHALGGLTISESDHPLTDGQSIAVSLAGPFAGAGLGAVCLALWQLGVADPRSDLERALVLLVLLNLGWGLINLVPILPLDGGHVMERLVHIVSPARVDTVPQYISIVVAVPAAVLAVANHQPLLGVIALGFVVFAIVNLRDHRRNRVRARQQRQVADALALLHHADPTRAIATLQQVVDTPMPDDVADPAVVGLAWALLWRRSPEDNMAVAHLIVRLDGRQPTALLSGALSTWAGRPHEAVSALTRGFAFETAPPPPWFFDHLHLDHAAVSALADWIDQLDLAHRHVGLTRLATSLDAAGRTHDAALVRSRMARPVPAAAVGAVGAFAR